MINVNFKKFINKKSGIATLPVVITVGMVALVISVYLTQRSFNEINNSQNITESSKASFYAEAGVRDALVRIARNKNYTCSSADCYSIDFANGNCSLNTDCAKVSVSSGLGTTLDPKVIVSKGFSKSITRTIQVEVFLDNGTSDVSLQNGEITSTSWQELTN